MDQIAGVLNRTATAKDLIVVDPWNHAITFARYYHGRARWVSLPDIEDHRTHRYDLVLHERRDPAGSDPVQTEVLRTLREGGRVFLAGKLFFSTGKAKDETLPTITEDRRTWHSVHSPYWSIQLTGLMNGRAEEFREIPLPGGPVSDFERSVLYEARGLRASSRPAFEPAGAARRADDRTAESP
jgi:hypothetical protein